MAEFVPINTQEEFDEAIKKRLAQQERKHQDALAALTEQHRTELDSLNANHKKEVDKLQAQIKLQSDNEARIKAYEEKVTGLSKDLKTAQDSIADSQKKIEEKNARIRAYEIDSVKTRIAREMKLPYDSVNFLRGEDEDGIRRSAEELRNLVGTQSAPMASNEPRTTAESDGGYATAVRNVLKNLNLKGE